MRTRCPRCGHLQVRHTSVPRVKCAACGIDYYRFRPRRPTAQAATIPGKAPPEAGP